MDKTCCMIKCNDTNNFTGRQFYQFPSDSNLCKKWVESCEDPQLLEEFNCDGVESLSAKTVCSWHFNLHDFIDPQLKRLKTNAIPKFSQCNFIKAESDDYTRVSYALIKKEGIVEHDCSTNINGTCNKNEVIVKDNSTKLNDEFLESEPLPNIPIQRSTRVEKPTENAIPTQLSSSSEVSNQEELELRLLLSEWKQDALANELIAEKVYVRVLKVIKRHHIERLLNKFDMGSQILFEHNLEQWRRSIGIPLDPLMASPSGFQFRSIGNPRPPSTSSSRSPPREQHSSPSLDENTNPINGRLSIILNGSPKGHMLVEYYNKFSNFQEEQRNSLIALIAHYFEEKEIKLSLSGSYQLEKEIIERFPSEKLEYYRTERRGRIYTKYYNAVTTFKRGVSKYVIETKTKKREKKSRHESTLSKPEENADSCLRTLKFHNLTAEQFDATWKACWKYRQHCIKGSNGTAEIIEKWPFYKTPSGYRLIDLDFKLAFNRSGNVDGLLEGWDEVCPKIHTFLNIENHVKDRSVKCLLEKLADPTISDDGRNASVMWALHGYLVPTSKIVKKDVTGKKSTTKFAIKDSQESVIFLGGSLNEVEDRIKHIKKAKQSLQPSVYGIGKSIFDIEEMFVHFDDIRFDITNVIRAIDICFKIIYLFDLKFPHESEMFFCFLESQFYKFQVPCKYPKVQFLNEFLNKTD